MMETSLQKGHHLREGEVLIPRFLGKIGNVKAAAEGNVLEKQADSNGSHTKQDEATERAPWLRVGQPSEGDINHVAQVWYKKNKVGG